MNISRRQILTGSVGLTGVAAVSGAFFAGKNSQESYPENPSTLRREFFGMHQAGIVDAAQSEACYIAYDCTCQTRSELQELFHILTHRSATLMAGFIPPPVGISAPPTDSGTLGTPVITDDLSISVGVGHSLFDHRFGFTGLCPRNLTSMPTFANDDLQAELCHGDILLQFRAAHADTVLHAVRDINRHTRRLMQMRWYKEGSISLPRPSGTPRNHFGFKDGTANPAVSDPQIADKYIWIADEEKADLPWTKYGTYQVVRLISMLTEFWDRISLVEQENIFGRNRDSGAPLDGTSEFDIPHYGDDPAGAAIPLNAHIRLANPRDPDSMNAQILRRGYNYAQGIDLNGNLDMGLIFTCFQRNIARGFEAIQLRLKDEPLVDYVIPRGGGYFFMLPGVRDSTGYLAQPLFEA